ncbi:MAG: hypothetical protein Q7P63_13115 [Verrucomicrobiota bacterium JB022]|nr:hypothetical protein [Verrucomicrobiota bacterium JB022]
MRLRNLLLLGGLAVAASAHAKQLNDTPTHDGWLKYGKLGWVWNAEYPWIYQQELGWIWASETSADPSAYWLYVTPVAYDAFADWYHYAESSGPWVYTDVFSGFSTEGRYWKWDHVKNGLQHKTIPIASLENVPDTPGVTVNSMTIDGDTLTLDMNFSGAETRKDFFVFASPPFSILENAEMIGAPRQSNLKVVDGAKAVFDVYSQGSVTIDLTTLVEAWGLQAGDTVSLWIGDKSVQWTQPDLTGSTPDGDLPPGPWGEVGN